MKKVGIFILGFAMIASTEAPGATISDMMPVLKKAKSDVSAALTAIDKDLADAAKRLASVDLKSDEGRKILSGVCKGRPYVYDCAVVDVNGKLGIMEPEDTRSYEGADISFEPQVKELLRTKAPVFSKVFKALDGTSRIDFEYPIIAASGEFLGAVSLLIKQDMLLKDLIEPAVETQSCKIWVMQTDGLIVYDPDPNQMNKNIFTDPMFKPFDDLVSFCRTVASATNGAGSYDFYAKGLEDKTLVKKVAVWDTIRMHGAEWRIVAMEVEKVLAEAKPD